MFTNNRYIPILFYHNVGNEKHKSFITIREFDRQMKFLKDRGCNTSSCDSLDSQSGNISITFDDGYEDNLINALPILKKYGFTATCFIVPNSIGKTNEWDITQHKLMDKIQIKEWIYEGMSIGSHSLSHLDLTIISIGDLRNEIESSKKYLEDYFQVSVDNFCYPFGKYNKNVINLVKLNGYKKAFTTNRGLYHINTSKPYEVKRVPISKNISRFKFWLKTSTIYENL
tara:strand:- start:48 stop:731 length:684 start_codon:yes stop_codon:yes gene_type:complete